MNDQRCSDILLKAEEVAIRCGVSKSLAYRMMATGEIPSVRLRSAVRVRSEDLEAFLKTNTRRREQESAQ